MLRLIVHEFRELFTGIGEKRMTDAFLESDRVATEEYNASGSIDVARVGRSKKFLTFLGLSEDSAEELTAMYVKSYPTIYAPVGDAVIVTRTLNKKFQLGALSNEFPDVQYQKLRTLDIDHLFTCIVLSGELGIRKPDPRIFWEATVRLAKKPEECLYVGNSYTTDILGAKSAGMQTCWFNPKGLHLSKREIAPDFEIGALNEILEILGCGDSSER